MAQFIRENPLWAHTVLPVVQEALSKAASVSSGPPSFIISLASIAMKRSLLSKVLMEVGGALFVPSTPPSRSVPVKGPPTRAFSSISDAALLPSAAVMSQVSQRLFSGSSGATSASGQWFVWRADSNGVKVLAASFQTQAAAEGWADQMEGKGHKQVFWVTQEAPASLASWGEAR